MQMYSLEGDAITPVRGKVGDREALQRPLEPLQHELLGRRLALVGADLVSQDEVPQQAQDEFVAAADNVFRACSITLGVSIIQNILHAKWSFIYPKHSTC